MESNYSVIRIIPTLGYIPLSVSSKPYPFFSCVCVKILSILKKKEKEKEE